MLATIALKYPVPINGESVRELSYDFDKIGVDLFMQAESRSAAKSLVSAGRPSSQMVEFDTGFHLYLGIAAVVAVNPDYTFEDIERVKGADLMSIARVGRNFTISGAEEDEEEDFDEPEEAEVGFPLDQE